MFVLAKGFGQFLEALDDSPFEETPVDLKTFMYSKEWSNLPPHSDVQEDIIDRICHFYYYKDMVKLYGKKEADRIEARKTRDNLLILSKGCSAPYSKVYNSQTGLWNRLDSLQEPNIIAGLNGPEKASASFQVGTGDMVRVKTEMGFEHDVYVGHRYWGMTQSKFYHRKKNKAQLQDLYVSDLKYGDRIATPLGLDVENPVSIGKDKAFVLGVFLGDGCMVQEYISGMNNCLSVDFGNIEPESLKKYCDIMDSWGEKYTVVSHTRSKMKTVRHFGINKSKAILLARDFGLEGKNCRTKEIPKEIFSLPLDELYEFIAGMWQTDGSVYSKKSQGNKVSKYVAEWSSVSDEMAKDFHLLLLRAGIPSILGTKKTTWTYKGILNRGYTNRIIISGTDKFTLFANKIPLSDHKSKAIAEGVLLNDNAHRPYNRIIDNFYMDKVKSVEPIGVGDYWSIEAEETEHFVENGLVSHNSGKNSMAQIIFTYVIYQLLCLKDPAVYLGKISGDNLDLVNMSLNARSASNTFFKTFVNRIKSIHWFDGKYNDRSTDILFDKGVNMHSLNSEHSSAEGMNVFYFLQDEPGGETLERATEMNQALSATIASRFAKTGRGLAISFARSKTDFMMTRWDDAVLEKESEDFSHTFKLNNNLEDGTEGNEFTIHWTEETATGYKYDNFYAVKLPTWRVNPTVSIEDFKMDFYHNEEDALMRFAAMPPSGDSNAFFKNHDKLERVFNGDNGYDHDKKEVIIPPDSSNEYFIHVDLSRYHDRTVVAMSHITEWQVYEDNLMSTDEPKPKLKTDLFRVWEPTKSDPVNHGEVAEFIVNLCKKFNVHTVSFDSWGIHGMIDYLTEVGINAVKQSLARPEYQELAMLVGEERLKAPYDERLLKELKGLIIKNGKVDHPTANTYNDITEAICGSTVMAVRNSIADSNLKVVSLGTIRRDQSLTQAKQHAKVQGQMPGELSDWIRQLDALNSKSKPND